VIAGHIYLLKVCCLKKTKTTSVVANDRWPFLDHDRYAPPLNTLRNADIRPVEVTVAIGYF
jgi:hypothetical protein